MDIFLKKDNTEKILNQIRDHYKKNLKITKKSFEEDRLVCSVNMVELVFGSCSKGLKSACLENVISSATNPKKREHEYSKGELIGKYKRLKKRVKYINVNISKEDFFRETHIDLEIILENFGDWNNFCTIVKS